MDVSPVHIPCVKKAIFTDVTPFVEDCPGAVMGLAHVHHIFFSADADKYTRVVTDPRSAWSLMQADFGLPSSLFLTVFP